MYKVPQKFKELEMSAAQPTQEGSAGLFCFVAGLLVGWKPFVYMSIYKKLRR